LRAEKREEGMNVRRKRYRDERRGGREGEGEEEERDEQERGVFLEW
jgi:hypothetical protein